MTLSFDGVAACLLGVGTTDKVLLDATRIAVVRDTVGRIRLALDAPDASESERQALEQTLQSALGGWYAGPAIYTDAGPSQKRVAQEVLTRASGHWPASWPTEAVDLVRGTSTPIDMARWGAVQRVLSKETWLSDQAITSPWELAETTPRIVSFYSYKGGVGRSTLVAVVAAILARAGEKVVVIDLDLEAPGQQALFDAAPTRGVIDYLVEHLALGASDLDGLLVDVTSEVDGATGSVHLAAAGSSGWSYVEKIARLDFVGHTHEGKSPVHAALVDLLRAVMKEKPAWILLDARTGIHDLGGLAMHALAHVDVLLARDGRQGKEGLALCLEALERRRKRDDLLALVVHALAPTPLSDETISKPVQERFRRAVYELFKRTVYSQLPDQDLPAEDDTSAPHAPYAIPLDEPLSRTELLRDMADIAIARPWYERIVERLRELSDPPEEEV